MADRIDVIQSRVLDRVVEHLREVLSLDARTCYLVVHPQAPGAPPGGDYFVTVAPGSSRFETADQHQAQLIEQSTVLVTIYSRIWLDSTGHDDRLLTQGTRGLLAIKRRILRALVGVDLEIEPGMVEGAGEPFVRQLIYVAGCGPCEYDEKNQLGWLTLEFGVDFDWDLTDGY